MDRPSDGGERFLAVEEHHTEELPCLQGFWALNLIALGVRITVSRVVEMLGCPNTTRYETIDLLTSDHMAGSLVVLIWTVPNDDTQPLDLQHNIYSR